MDVFYPINIDMKDIKVLIIGLGNIGYRKFCNIKDICDDIKIISKNISKDKLDIISFMDNVKYEIKNYETCDIDSYDMIFACTDDEYTQNKIISDVKLEQKNRFILVNCCKNKDKSNFHNMAVLEKNNYNIAISTKGENPVLSKEIQKKLDKLKI